MPVTKGNNSKTLAGKKGKQAGEDNVRAKYYWRGKTSGHSKKEGRSKGSKRGVWSELDGHLNGRWKGKYLSRGK